MHRTIQSRSLPSRLILTAMVLSLASVGCSRPETTGEKPIDKIDAAGQADAREQLVASDPVDPNRSGPPPWEVADADPQMMGPSGSGPSGLEPSGLEPGQPEPPRNLRDDLSPDQLVEFLAAADRDMELIHTNRSGIEGPRASRDALLQIVNMKLQAARQLAGHPDASPETRSEGDRGELQSLSHLAALSDVRAAEELEKLARSNMSSDDPKLVADSRLVLIGFAIESLQNGREGAPKQIVQHVSEIAQSGSTADVPALIVMGQAKQMLENYGYSEMAKQVRDTIIEVFGNSNNPDLVAMAAQIAGNIHVDGVDQLRGEILQDADITVAQWCDSVEALIDESADLQTVRYLAGASVDFEANGMPQFADATLNVLNDRFTQPDAATTREVQTAIDATEARANIIGKKFDPDLPTIDGAPLSLSEFQGKVVLVPFWGMGIPLSLQPIPALQSIRDAHADQVVIVGVNLDPADAPLDQFLHESKIGFPSYRLASDQPSTIPKDFGMVSMPFVAILDRDGKVAALQLSEKNLQQTVQRLIAE